MVERWLGVLKVVGSIPQPRHTKSRKKMVPVNLAPLLTLGIERRVLGKIWLVGPVSAYNVTGWGAPVKCLRQERYSVAALF